MTLIEPSLADRAKLEQTRGLCAVERSYAVEGIEVRAPQEGDHYAHFNGLASATDRSYEMYGGPDKGGWNETVDKGSFKRTLGNNPDVPFLINHTGMTLARTKAGNLSLEELTTGKRTGLSVDAPKLDTRVSVVNDLVLLMDAGNIDEMSFAFRVKKQAWLNADGEEVPWWDMAGIDRHIQEVDIHKGDVSVVNYGANPHTDAVLRSLADLRSMPLEDCDEAELRDAIAYLESLIPPAPPVEVHPDLIAAQHKAIARHAALRVAVL